MGSNGYVSDFIEIDACNALCGTPSLDRSCELIRQIILDRFLTDEPGILRSISTEIIESHAGGCGRNV